MLGDGVLLVISGIICFLPAILSFSSSRLHESFSRAIAHDSLLFFLFFSKRLRRRRPGVDSAGSACAGLGWLSGLRRTRDMYICVWKEMRCV